MVEVGGGIVVGMIEGMVVEVKGMMVEMILPWTHPKGHGQESESRPERTQGNRCQLTSLSPVKLRPDSTCSPFVQMTFDASLPPASHPLSLQIRTEHLLCARARTQNWATKMCKIGPAWWLMPVIPTLSEAEVGRSRGQEIETIMANTVKPSLY
ncbi:NANOG neighbor homeobox [Plecturocebus cupreus]